MLAPVLSVTPLTKTPSLCGEARLDHECEHSPESVILFQQAASLHSLFLCDLRLVFGRQWVTARV